jgi:hypothetical protein
LGISRGQLNSVKLVVSSTDSGATAAVAVVGAAAAGLTVAAAPGAASGEIGRPRLPREGGTGRVWRQVRVAAARTSQSRCAAACLTAPLPQQSGARSRASEAVGRLEQSGV